MVECDAYDPTKELIEQAHKGDLRARELLITKNMGLIGSIVKRFEGRGTDREDLFQIGSIGLIKAVDNFDTSYEVKFSTYAVPVIAGEIKRFLRDDGMLKVSRSLKENAVKCKRAAEILRTSIGREPTVEEISNEVSLEAAEVVSCLEAVNDVDSIYKTMYKSDGSEIMMIDKLEDKRDSNETLINNLVVKELLEGLPEVEKQIIHLRYYDCKTQSEIAKELGLSQVQVSRIEKRALIKMRQRI